MMKWVQSNWVEERENDSKRLTVDGIIEIMTVILKVIFKGL